MNNIQRIKKEQARDRRNRFFLNFVSGSKLALYTLVCLVFFFVAGWALYVGLWAVFAK